jgi:hypothetical protein
MVGFRGTSVDAARALCALAWDQRREQARAVALRDHAQLRAEFDALSIGHDEWMAYLTGELGCAVDGGVARTASGYNFLDATFIYSSADRSTVDIVRAAAIDRVADRATDQNVEGATTQDDVVDVGFARLNGMGLAAADGGHDVLLFSWRLISWSGSAVVAAPCDMSSDGSAGLSRLVRAHGGRMMSTVA